MESVMTADARADLLRDIGIRMAILRQRSPWVLRDLVQKDRMKQERAEATFIRALEACMCQYKIQTDNDANKPVLHSCP